MKKRRSIREYTNEDIPPEIINEILKAGQQQQMHGLKMQV